MNWTKRIGALALIALLTFTPLTPAWAVEDDAAEEQTVTTEDGADDEVSDEDTAEEDASADEDTNAEGEDGEESEDAENAEQAQPAEPEETAEPDLDPTIELSAGASICVNAETGEIIHENNAKEKMYPASTTKVMTALLVLENCEDLSETVTMKKIDFTDVANGASSAGLQVGETVTVEDLLYCMLLPSGNEAANALARYIGGDVESFAKMMNDRADDLGCVNSHFVNPNGLHDDDHYTCAYDLYLIAQAAMQFDSFQTIVNTAQKNLSPTNKAAEHPNGKNLYILTTNQLILSSGSKYHYAYAKGVKTGHTSQAGYCLVATATKKKSSLISVMLGCERPKGADQPLTYQQTKELFEWGYANFSAKTLIEKGAEIQEIPVRLSTDTDKLMLVAGDDLSATVPNDCELSDFETQITVPDDVTAPITAGQKIGTLTLVKDGVTYGQVDLLSLSEVSLSEVLYYADLLENFFRSGLFKIILVTLILLLIFYVAVYIIRERRRRQRRRAMMRSKRARMEQYERDQNRENK